MQLRRAEVTVRWREEEDMWERRSERYEGVTTNHSYTPTLDTATATTKQQKQYF